MKRTDNLIKVFTGYEPQAILLKGRMNLPAASRRGISEEFVFNLAASSGELTPNEIRKNWNICIS